MGNNDKAGEEYWEKEWADFKIPDPKKITHKSTSNYIQYSYHLFFTEVFMGSSVKGKKILEVGCGNSGWLPYFNKEWGLIVAGLDYSVVGCKKAEAILQNAGIKGTIHHADMFSPPEDMIESYDYVCSFGVVEHFEDTVNAIMAVSRFLKPGGVLITTVPNHNGVAGTFQRIFSKKVYSIHKIIDHKILTGATKNAGLNTIKEGYFINFSFYANPGIKEKGNPFFYVKKFILKITAVISHLFWFKELFINKSRPSKSYSAAVYNISKKPDPNIL